MKKHIRIFTFIIMGLCFPALVSAECPRLKTEYSYNFGPYYDHPPTRTQATAVRNTTFISYYHGAAPECKIKFSKDELCKIFKDKLSREGVPNMTGLTLDTVIWGANWPFDGSTVYSYGGHSC